MSVTDLIPQDDQSPPLDLALVRIEAGWRALAEARTVAEVASVISGAELLRQAIGRAGMGLRAQNEAARLKIEAQATAGSMLAEMPKQRPGEYQRLDGLTVAPTLAEHGVTRFQSHYWQRVAAVPSDVRERFYRRVEQNVDLSERRDGDETQKIEPLEATTTGMLRDWQMAVHQSSEEDEWLTPSDVLTRVVAVLGAIDLDPCSNTFGPPNVPASRRFTAAENGLSRPWQGRVFLNPPYGSVIGDWVAKLRDEYISGEVEAAIALVPARTDTAWFGDLRDAALCLVSGRLRFSGSANSAPFPSAVAYLGPDLAAFVEAFAALGDVWCRYSSSGDP